MTHSDGSAEEQQLHDEWASTIDVEAMDVLAHFESGTTPENRFIVSKLGDVKAKRLLDLGCGAGENSVYFALRGADCLAVDLSPGMIDTANRLAKKHGVTIETMVKDASILDFPAESFDIVYASNFLHHVDAVKTIEGIHRVLRKNGTMCTWDPLKHNPIINIYRALASDVRSPGERPLNMNIIGQIRKMFSYVEYDSFWLFTLWIFIRFYLIERVNPGKERYWKKIIYEHQRLAPLYYRLEKLDILIKRMIPFVKRYGWNLAIVATK